MIAYVTKYALTHGIIEVRGELMEKGKYFKGRSGGRPIFVRLGTDALPTREEAEKRVQKMIENKIASLRKQIAKLERLLNARPSSDPG